MMLSCFEYALVPFEGVPQPLLRPLPDLSRNLAVAQAIVDRIESFFGFEGPWPTFSGFARAADRFDGPNPLLYAMVADETGVYRSFAFRGIGFVGVIYIEDRTGRPQGFSDWLYAIQWGLCQEGPAPVYEWEERCLGLICSGRLWVGIDL